MLADLILTMKDGSVVEHKNSSLRYTQKSGKAVTVITDAGGVSVEIPTEDIAKITSSAGEDD